MNNIITVDFDDTLCFYNDILKPNKKLINLIKTLSAKNYLFYIVTARSKEYDDMFSSLKINDFIKKYNIPIEKVVYTDGAMKGKTLNKLNSKLHIDNDLDQVKSCKESGIKTIYLRNL